MADIQENAENFIRVCNAFAYSTGYRERVVEAFANVLESVHSLAEKLRDLPEKLDHEYVEDLEGPEHEE